MTQNLYLQKYLSENKTFSTSRSGSMNPFVCTYFHCFPTRGCVFRRSQGFSVTFLLLHLNPPPSALGPPVITRANYRLAIESDISTGGMAKNSASNPRSFSELYPNENSLAVRRRRILEKFWTSGTVRKPPAVTVSRSSRDFCRSSILSWRSIHRHPFHLLNLKGSQNRHGPLPAGGP